MNSQLLCLGSQYSNTQAAICSKSGKIDNIVIIVLPYFKHSRSEKSSSEIIRWSNHFSRSFLIFKNLQLMLGGSKSYYRQ